MLALVGAMYNAQIVQKGSSNGGPRAVPEGALDGGFNVAFE